MLAGAQKRHDADRLLHLYGAWHVAAWNSAAKVGKLKPWSEYARELTGASSQPIPKDWRTRKAERQAQMEQLTKRQKQRARPPRRRT